MSVLPSGTVTFAFTDLEGSTGLLRQLGDRYGDLLAGHRRIVRETFTAANGAEIDTHGDAFFFAFPRARDAVAAAIGVQCGHAAADWPDGATVRVRIGLHTGEPAVGSEGYLGLDVVKAARICTLAPGGNILISESTRSLLGSSLPERVSVVSLGERHLKGISEPEPLYQLGLEGLTETQERPSSRLPDHWANEIERHFGDVGARLAVQLHERVVHLVEGAVHQSPAPVKSQLDDENVDHLAARGVGLLQDKIRSRVETALAANSWHRQTRKDNPKNL